MLLMGHLFSKLSYFYVYVLLNHTKIERSTYGTKDIHSIMHYAFIDPLLTVKPHYRKILNKSINFLVD